MSGLEPIQPIMDEMEWVAAVQSQQRAAGGAPTPTSQLQAQWAAMRLRQRRAASTAARAGQPHAAPAPDVHQQMAAVVQAHKYKGVSWEHVQQQLQKQGVIGPVAGEEHPIQRLQRAARAPRVGRAKALPAEDLAQLRQTALNVAELCRQLLDSPLDGNAAQQRHRLEGQLALLRGTVNYVVSANALDTGRMRSISSQHQMDLARTYGREGA